ncbi:MAG: trypsin-like peptidase domain-containing protein [Chthonomonadales bacterium]|nr:trypsin-like peptidase domain-containing protein [Chthonomonadales bacterium]
MRRGMTYVAVFGLGAVLGIAMLRVYGQFRQVSADGARRGLIRLLERAPRRAAADESAVVLAAARIRPAVVNIDTLEERRGAGLDMMGRPVARSLTRQGKGSGVILSRDGFIVTNNHVVEGAEIIRVTTAGGTAYDGTVVGADAESDLAIVKVDAGGLPVAEMGDSDLLRVGETVIAIGNPLGIGVTVTHGIISATHRRDLPVGGGRVLHSALQTDAPINRGNSGGALANSRGELIGINTAIASEGGGNIGIGFAIPINAARGILRDLLESGRSRPAMPSVAFAGITYEPLTPETASLLRVPTGRGVVITEVMPLTGAADAGLHRGDVVLAVDGALVMDPTDVRDAILRHRAGERVVLRMLRGNGAQEDVAVTLGRRPASVPAP